MTGSHENREVHICPLLIRTVLFSPKGTIVRYSH